MGTIDEDGKFSLIQENPLSLRTVLFQDTGYVAWMMFLPLKREVVREPPVLCWLFRRKVAWHRRRWLIRHLGTLYEAWKQLENLEAPFPPSVEFLWSSDGRSVAALVSGETIGFIAHGKDYGYAKLLRKGSSFGNAWNGELFNELFV